MTVVASDEGSLTAIRRYVLWGGIFTAVLVFGVGTWLGMAKLSGAVIASGSVSVLTDVKKVQPAIGGVVRQIEVRDGQSVRAGEPLVHLDDTVARARLTFAEQSLTELYGRRSRLLAERDGRAEIQFDEPSYPGGSGSPHAEVWASEIRLFELRKDAVEGRKEQLREQIEQTKEAVVGYQRQADAYTSQYGLILQELEAALSLLDMKLVTVERVSSLEREAARLDGETGRLEATVAQLSGKLAELELAILQIDKELFSEVALELRDVDTRILQLEEQRILASDQIKNLTLAAPQTGIVHQLQVQTIGGVVAAGDVLMLIVPTSDRLVVEARLSPTDIDQVRVGSEVRLLFPAFNQRITPELIGTVDYLSADTALDQQTGAVYYAVRVSVAEQEISKLREFSLVPGMPVEVFIKTGDRRVISILTKPFIDQLNRAFRQD